MKLGNNLVMSEGKLLRELTIIKCIQISNNALDMKEIMEAEAYIGSPIEILNDDCLELIFSQFRTIAERTRLELVCKRWQAIILNSWKSIKFLDLTKNTALNWGIPQTTLAKRLNVPGLRKILRCCGDNLLELDTSDNRQLSRAVLENSGEFCSKLISVKIRGCTWPYLDENKSLGACKNLTRIEIKHANDECLLLKLFAMLNNLKCIKIHGDPLSCSIGYSFLNLPQTIEEIRLINVAIHHPNFDIAIKKLPNLHSIELDSCSNMHDETFRIINQNEKIKYLKLHGSYLINNISGVVQTIPDFMNLEVLELTTMSKDFMKRISKIGIPSVAIDNMWRDTSIDDELLIQIARNCRKLRCLDISGSTAITDEGLTHLASSINLEKLIINFVIEVTDNSLSKFHSLKILQCVGCEEVRDDGIISLIHDAPNLEVLDVSLTSIEDKTIEAALNIVTRRKNKLALRLAVGYTATFLPSASFFQSINEETCLLKIIDDTLFDVI